MIQVIEGGDEVFGGFMYGDLHPNTMNFLQQQVVAPISNTLTDIGKNLYSNLSNVFERFHGSDTMRLVRQARQKASNFLNQDVIKSLQLLSDIQLAGLQMQRWVMAHPGIRQRYHEQRCDGYSDTYIDYYPQDIGEDHYDYRRVMDGLVQEDEDGNMIIKHYYDDTTGDVELSIEERSDILDTWEVLNYYLHLDDDDPTDRYNGKF